LYDVIEKSIVRVVRCATVKRGMHMVVAYHVIFTAYGFWLPNDPRGSWSDFVASWEMFKYGGASKTDTRQSVAGLPHNRAFREQAKEGLKYPPVLFTGIQARAIGRGITAAIRRSNYVIHACAILPDHVHMVIARHEQRVEQAVQQMKGEATKQFHNEGIHPLAAFVQGGEKPATPWARKCWKVFLDSSDDVQRSIKYVEGNPDKEQLPRQAWSFVTPFDGDQ